MAPGSFSHHEEIGATVSRPRSAHKASCTWAHALELWGAPMQRDLEAAESIVCFSRLSGMMHQVGPEDY